MKFRRYFLFSVDLYWKNPQFFIRLKDPDSTDDRRLCTMIVSLMEKEKDNTSQVAIGFDIYEVTKLQMNSAELTV